MKIHSVTLNDPCLRTGVRYRSISRKRWHERLRLKLIGWLLKGLQVEEGAYWITTGVAEPRWHRNG